MDQAPIVGENEIGKTEKRRGRATPGPWYDRIGTRLVTVAGMPTCVAGLVLLFAAMDGTTSSLTQIMLALAIFGAGRGLFISPNNRLIMATAPAQLKGEARGVLNVMRSLGISLGIATSSALLSWRPAILTGSGHNSLHAPAFHLSSAGRDVVLLLGSVATIAAGISLVGTRSRSAASSAKPRSDGRS
jgi:MFS family permease